ncbi:hypothetical protein Esi_0017_0187 [Ectocarpus siliculosus]|uniref:Uncharacterized protein n=1 Tax=Ectocarpus siliculosus TaxID=2880 RepID=D7FMQ3_ECTSI|nr:hypothetical protein Esi_0017_0187 [Ectocarpus siliculosus]|eukprot:CBJ25950.1 hypothetical protein Esi_0017_0187 [Ectocarpus siliculosus]
MWNQFTVRKARLPKTSDIEADWAGTVGRPEELKLFLGLKNTTNRKTVGFLQRCIDEKLVMEGILLRGPAGSGKSALVKVFVSEFLERFTSTPQAFARLYRTRVLNVNRQELAGSPKKLASRLRRFFSAKKDRLSEIVPRFIVVDGMERILERENVGFELLAVKVIFRAYWPDLQQCIAAANKVFCEREFLSEENALKAIAPKTLAAREEMSHHVKASDSLEPLGVCQACTLRPPCQHISEQELASRGMRRRMELPQRRGPQESTQEGKGGKGDGEKDFVDCQDFVMRGACRSFNERGRCSNHHPLDAHVVEVPKPRCPQCTIRLPCGHCDYDQSRRSLHTFCEAAGARIQKRIGRLHRLLKTGGGGGDNKQQPGSMTKSTVKASGDAGGHEGAQGRTNRTTDNTRDSPTVAANKNPSATKSAKQQQRSTFESRASKANRRGVEAVLSKLGEIGRDLEAQRAWTTDTRTPGGGMHEFRASVFDKKLERLFRRCEEANEEADAESEAYLLLLENVR